MPTMLPARIGVPGLLGRHAAHVHDGVDALQQASIAALSSRSAITISSPAPAAPIRLRWLRRSVSQ